MIPHVRQLRQAIDEFVMVHNQDAAPFEWTKFIDRPGRLCTSCAELIK